MDDEQVANSWVDDLTSHILWTGYVIDQPDTTDDVRALLVAELDFALAELSAGFVTDETMH